MTADIRALDSFYSSVMYVPVISHFPSAILAIHL
jgi:hypothetical protein